MAYGGRWRFVGRYTGTGLVTAAATPAQGTRILGRNVSRLALSVYNAGSGAAYLREEPEVATIHDVLPAGAVLSIPAPFGPYNELWAVGDAGCDLRVSELVREVAE